MQLSEWQVIVLFGSVILAFLAVASAALSYGLLAPWWRSRTGIGFLSTKIAFTWIIGLTLLGGAGVEIHFWLAVASWLFVAVAMFYGVTWNILYQQYFKQRPDYLGKWVRVLRLRLVRSYVRLRVRNRNKKKEAHRG